MKSMPLLQLVAMGLPAVGYALAWWMEPTRRARRALEQTSSRRLGDLHDGERGRIEGIARRLHEAVVSPVTGRRCIGYRFVIEEKVADSWNVVVRGGRCCPFELVSEDAEATVEGPFLFGLDFDDRGEVWANLPPGVFRVLEEARVSLSGPFGGEREFRFREAALRSSDRIEVLGRVSIDVDPSGRRDSFRGPPVRRMIRGSAHEPITLADADEEVALALAAVRG
jgi:hypothetical protein